MQCINTLEESKTSRNTGMALLAIPAILILCQACKITPSSDKINRYELVSRHNILVEQFDSLSSLSVGNGDFAFTTDITGLQTFYEAYSGGIPLGTQSNWGWHVNSNPENYKLSESVKVYNVKGRDVPYLHQYSGDTRQARSSEYFRANPHRLHLGFIRLMMLKENGSLAEIGDIRLPKHRLDLWQGKITSEFIFDSEPVRVEVFCHQNMDLISAKIESSLLSEGRLFIQCEFSYGVPLNTHPGYNLAVPEKHQSIIRESDQNHALIERILDKTKYIVALQWDCPSSLIETGKHTFQLRPHTTDNTLEFSCLFTQEKNIKELPGFQQTQNNSIHAWKNFWESGGAIDFSGCTDPRANELERRTILSQYLTKIQSSGSLPPAETGLTYNSWYGKFHLEMHWWHSVHFALWNRCTYLTKQMEYYERIFPRAERTAQDQGYRGVRWPKMVGPDGRESPSAVGTYLIWQQPHCIYFAELIYRNSPTKEVLNKYKDLVFATADFMADFVQYDSVSQLYNLLPPLIPAQEIFNRDSTVNPPFELSYWHWGLSTAQKWRQRLSMESNTEWDRIIQHLAPPVALNELYMGTANTPDSYTDQSKMRDHPVVLGSYGILPFWEKMDTAIMHNTLNTILLHWNWSSTWGWDYPMIGMTAARLNEPGKAIEILLKNVPKNTYLLNGHNYQSSRLRTYLPGNGGFLTAIAMMCAGWEGCETDLPGFPKDGKWNVKWENISRMF